MGGSVQRRGSERGCGLWCNADSTSTVWCQPFCSESFLSRSDKLSYSDQDNITDNTTAVSYINRQGGTRFLSLSGVSGPLGRQWRLHPFVVAPTWSCLGRAEVELFTFRANTYCHQVFSMTDSSAPPGMDALVHLWPHTLLYALSPVEIILPVLDTVSQQGLSLILARNSAFQQVIHSQMYWGGRFILQMIKCEILTARGANIKTKLRVFKIFTRFLFIPKPYGKNFQWSLIHDDLKVIQHLREEQ